MQRRSDDCLRAAVAFVLDIPYGHTPRIGAWSYHYAIGGRRRSGPTHKEWVAHWERWAQRRGLHFIRAAILHLDPPARPWIAEVIQAAGGRHAVIFCGRDFVYDPDAGKSAATYSFADVIGSVDLVPA